MRKNRYDTRSRFVSLDYPGCSCDDDDYDDDNFSLNRNATEKEASSYRGQ